MLESLLNKTIELKKKQKEILYLSTKSGNKITNLKIHRELSPLGWHIMHCLYIEAIWIRSKILNDDKLEKKFKKIADAAVVSIENRGKVLPKAETIIRMAQKIFKENVTILERLIYKKNKNILMKDLNYFLDFLNQHHAQHIENMKNILNISNMVYGNKKYNATKLIEPSNFTFSGIKIKEGMYRIGANKKKFFYDNEIPNHKVFLKDFTISKYILTISEWLGFIEEGGYSKKKYWSSAGWNWKAKNKIAYPFNWVFIDRNKFIVSTYKGFISPSSEMPVTNISIYELEAFAKFNNCRLPHELEWEAAYAKIMGKYKVWEWSSNKFFGYKGFTPFPYKEYSMPWFDNEYFTLRGGSSYTLKEIKRASFRNFYKPSTRYILSGGRLVATSY